MEQESIYRLVPVQQEPAPKPALYKSKHSGNVSPAAVPCSSLGVKKVRMAATMGPGSGQEVVSPTKFLHAHEKEPRLPERESGSPGVWLCPRFLGVAWVAVSCPRGQEQLWGQ